MVKRKLGIQLLIIALLLFFLSFVPVYATGTTSPLPSDLNQTGTINEWITKQIYGVDWGISLNAPVIEGTINSADSIQDDYVDVGLSDEDSLSNYVADSVMDGVLSWIADKYAEFTSTFAKFLLHNYRPSLDVFNEKIGSTGISMFQNFIYIGYTISVFLFIFIMIMIALGGIRLAEVKQTPFQTFGLFGVAFFLIAYSSYIAQGMITIAGNLWDFVGSGNVYTDTSTLKQLLAPFNLIKNIFGFTAALKLIFGLIVGIIFLIKFVKLMLEVIERYIVACFLAYVFPLPAATIVSKTTSGIFKKYLQMFIIQLLMLILNLIFLTIILAMGLRVLLVSGGDIILEWMFLFGFMKVAQKIDNYAFTMGLSVAVTGGNVLDSIGSSLLGMAGMARSIKAGVGLAGAAMAKQGAAAGDLRLLRMGRKLGDVSNPTKPRDASTIGNLKAAEQMGNLKNIAQKLQAKDIDDSIIHATLTGSGFQQLNATSMGFKTELLKQAYGAESVLKNATNIDSINFDKRGTATVSMTKVASNGQSYQEVVSFSANAGNLRGTINSLQNTNGDEVYYTAKSNFRAGDEIGYTAANHSSPSGAADGSSNAEMASGVDFNLLGDTRNAVQSIEKLEDGGILFKGENGIVARMDKNQNIAFNDRDHEWDVDKIASLKGLRDVRDIRIKDNQDGTATLIGKDVNDKEQYREYTLFNKALYSKDDLNGKGIYRTSFGANNSNTGSYMVMENKTKNSSHTQPDLKVKYTQMDDAKHIRIRRG